MVEQESEGGELAVKGARGGGEAVMTEHGGVLTSRAEGLYALPLRLPLLSRRAPGLGERAAALIDLQCC